MALACVDGGLDFEEAEGAGQHVAGEEEDERLGVAHATLHALRREIGRLHVQPRQPAQVLGGSTSSNGGGDRVLG